MKYNGKYDLYIDNDLIIYYWNKIHNKLMQIPLFKYYNGYYVVQTKLGVRKVHRVIWETFNGEIPDSMQIDHINTIRTDNRLYNLRCVTPKDNMNNNLTRNNMSLAKRGNTRTVFSIKFKEHYGITNADNHKLYNKEYTWFKRHNNKCRWE